MLQKIGMSPRRKTSIASSFFWLMAYARREDIAVIGAVYKSSTVSSKRELHDKPARTCPETVLRVLENVLILLLLRS